MRSLAATVLVALSLAGCMTLDELTRDQRDLAQLCTEFDTQNKQIICLEGVHDEIANIATTIEEHYRAGSISADTAARFHERLTGVRSMTVDAEELLLMLDTRTARAKLSAVIAALELLEDDLQ